MAVPVKVTDIRFEMEGICELFDSVSAQHIDVGTELLVVASKYGTRIIGHPSSRELHLLYFKDKTTMPRSKYELRGTPRILSLNREENILAVNYTANNTSYIDLLIVNSFMSSKDLIRFHRFRFDYKVNQILWSPVEKNRFTICLNDGSLTLCSLKDDKCTFETIERKKARRVAWSSQKNEIVVAFPNGVLNQYQLESGSVKCIKSQENLFDGPYEPIALQWLSTNQFAAIFLENSFDAQPTLYIITARGDERPTYMRIDNTYYSSSASEVYLLHLPQWNLILTGSRNDAQINILTTDGPTDAPSWVQLKLVDETRSSSSLPVEEHGPFSMLGIALENLEPRFSGETPLISTVLTCGRLVTVKIKLTKTLSPDANKFVFGTSCIFPRTHGTYQMETSTEPRFVADNFPTFEALAASHKSFAQEAHGMNIQFVTMLEKLTDAVQEFHSVFRGSLIATDDSTRFGRSDKWLEYLHSLASAAETTTDLMELAKKHLHTLITTLGRKNIITREKTDLSCYEARDGWSTPNNLEVVSMEIDHIETGVENLKMCPDTSPEERPQQSMKEMPNPESHPFACHICDKRYAKKSWLTKHERKIHAARQNKNRANYRPIRRKERPIKIVPATVSQESNLKVILKFGSKSKTGMPNRKSSESNPFSCDICDKRYLQKSGVSRHIHKVHVKRHPESIATAKKNLPTGVDLEISETQTIRLEIERSGSPKDNQLQPQTHDESRKFACMVCEKQFPSKKQMLCHVNRAHSTLKAKSKLQRNRRNCKLGRNFNAFC